MNACHHCEVLFRELPTYREQLRQKAEFLLQAFEDVGLSTETLEDEAQTAEAWSSEVIAGFKDLIHNYRVDPSPRVDSYRNTAKLVFGFNRKSGEIQLGIYRPGTHRLIDLEHCRDHHGAMEPILAFVKEGARRLKLPVYHEGRQKGFLRYFLLRILPSGQCLCTFVTPHAEGGWQDALTTLTAELVERFPEIVSVTQNINPTTGNEVLGPKSQLLNGQQHIPCTFLETPVLVSAASFLQANLSVYALILEAMRKNLQRLQQKTEAALRIADLYCGCGAIGLSITDQEPLLLLEGNPVSQQPLLAAVQDDEREEILVSTGRAEESFEVLEAFNPDLIIVNPPRKGLAADLCRKLLDLSPDTIYYLSCNPISLARDLKRLNLGSAYRLTALRSWDMMPGTQHFETFAQLQRI